MRKAFKSPSNIVLLVLSVLIVIASLVLLYMSFQTNKAYDIEVKITPSPSIAPPTLASRPTEALLRMGSISTDVKALQSRLKQLGYYQGDVDGQFGGATRDAVSLFQQQHGLASDGLAGADTLNMLYGSSAHTIQVTPVPSPPSLPAADLPILVNRTNSLKDGYVPKNLVLLKDILTQEQVVLKNAEKQAVDIAAKALSEMLTAAQTDGVMVWQVSEAYRTWDEQRLLFTNEKNKYLGETGTEPALTETAAEKQAEKHVAKPGTSEHQTGLAFDLTVPDRSFSSTEQARWLRDNCWDHGFILRYPPGKEEVTGFSAEPWHIRYVGKDISKYMQLTGLVLEEYLERVKP